MRRRPDNELIDLARKGSSEPAGALFDRYWDHAWRAAYAVTADRALADDAAQDAVQRAFGALDRFDDARPFGPWLKRIAANRAIDLLRLPLVPNVGRRGPGTYRVEVYSYVPSGGKPVIFTGRQIELQRLSAATGQWIRIRRGKLVGFGTNLYNRTYFANFTVPRGLTLRAFVPAKTAVPCWASAAPDTFKS